MTPDEAITAIERATSASALFQAGCDPASEYKRLLALVHPDRFPAGKQRDRAGNAAGKLAKLYHETNGRPKSATIIGKWVVEAPFVKGDLADLYLVTREDRTTGVLKIARHPRDNDLMDAEARALKTLWEAEPEQYRKYLPALLDTFQASGRRANVLTRYPDLFTLRQIVEMLPQKVPFRHIVWMMNRLLSLIGFSQRSEYAHGGVIPDHLLYHPKTHGMVVVGWCSAVTEGSVKIVSTENETFYPGEILKKRSAAHGTDIFMAAKSMMWAADAIPDRFKRAFEWCLAPSPSARPQDAWAFQDTWNSLAVEEFGPPKYVELKLPRQ